MILSPAEKDFLYESLIQKPPIRPDARKEYQYRPLEAKTSFLPGSNGSARIRLLDGSECIVSVKSKVVLKTQESNIIEVDIDVSGYRDDSNFVSTLKYNLTSMIMKNFPIECLQLTSKYTFKLFIDCIVISHTSYPLSLISFTSYLALKSTKLPLLVSEVNDEDVEEQPTFSDDWDRAVSLNDFFNNTKFQPPIIISIGTVGSNLLFDPSVEEEQVLENGLVISFLGESVISPINNLNLATNSNNNNFKGVKKDVILESLRMCNKHCGFIVKALDNLIEQDDGGYNTIF
ncbi:uncharacterized protein PRCAT00000493001 [Priceomyces carsonii]|uniref:uncharacterized protein n=1 Tax=Priceomyces carsonii TaxID=28549 RepID=UPI002ED9F6A6|nr:unnamed protein product [Priceomyces carsonii]